MSAELEKLPFVPPVEGCQIERIHHFGPFITRVDLRLPDGTPWVWTLRRHRYLEVMRSLPAEAAVEEKTIRWWIKTGVLARIGWCIAALFMIGSTCFAAAIAAGLAPKLFGGFAQNPLVKNLVFFVGSIFFTLAAVVLRPTA